LYEAKQALLEEKSEIKCIGYTKESKQWKEKYTYTNSNGELECSCGKIMNASACGEYHVFTHLTEGNFFFALSFVTLKACMHVQLIINYVFQI